MPQDGSAIPAKPHSLHLAPPRQVDRLEDCLFYHTMELPGIGLIRGEWGLRRSEAVYLGQINLEGRTVLEIGPASGHLSFWMERQGAKVVAYDLDEHQEWDLVPYDGMNLSQIALERREILKKLNNSWWFARACLRATSLCAYGSVYNLDASLGKFDIVTLNSVLLHTRDPFLALRRAAERSEKQIVVTDVSERQFAASNPEAGAELSMHFIPRSALRSPLDAWWYIPSGLTAEMLKILGFASVDITFHQHRFKDGHVWDFYTAVGTR